MELEEFGILQSQKPVADGEEDNTKWNVDQGNFL